MTVKYGLAAVPRLANALWLSPVSIVLHVSLDFEVSERIARDTSPDSSNLFGFEQAHEGVSRRPPRRGASNHGEEVILLDGDCLCRRQELQNGGLGRVQWWRSRAVYRRPNVSNVE